MRKELSDIIEELMTTPGEPPEAEVPELYLQYRDEDKKPLDPENVKKLNRPFTFGGKAIVTLMSIVYIFAIWYFTPRSQQWYLIGGPMFFYLLIKLAFALIYRPFKDELTKDYKVSIIITCFNEKPESIVSIFDNIKALDYPVHEVLFLDDGSADTTAYEVALSYSQAHPDTKYNILRFEENRGKKAVMIEGFARATGDYVFMLDSDSEIMPNALTELLRPFEKEKTTSVVGHIGVLNKKNFVTKMQAMTYYNAFQLGRASQSARGNVVVCSGAFSLHRLDFILENLEDFEEDKCFGIPVSSGDDRLLTKIAKSAKGRTVYQNTAYCETIVPEKWRALIKQRRRWQRSGYLISLKAIKDTFPRSPLYMAWSFLEAYLWLVALILWIISIIARGGVDFDLRDAIIFTSIVMFKQNGFYILYRPIHFVLVPIYTIVYGLFLIFIRAYAIVTIFNDDWGTRKPEEDKVEIVDAPVYEEATPVQV